MPKKGRASPEPDQYDDQGTVDVGAIEKAMMDKDQENQYLRSRNFGLNDAMAEGMMPRPDANVVEFKLSSEDLLDKIEHYLRGDVLKHRKNEDGQEDSYYAAPTKKISVTLFQNKKNGRVYIINEYPDGSTIPNWQIMSLFEKGEDDELVEVPLEENYKAFYMKELLDGLSNEKGKKPYVENIGPASKEVIDTSKMNLSEDGVQEVMNILSMYINKETFLSWYKEERIYEIMADIGDTLNKFFLINSKKLGLDTEYKKTKYPVIIVTILHSIENAYRRALLGSENKGTREGIIVTQHQGVGDQMYGGGGMGGHQAPKKKWSPWDRSTW